jgi:hypothetical protein
MGFTLSLLASLGNQLVLSIQVNQLRAYGAGRSKLRRLLMR